MGYDRHQAVVQALSSIVKKQSIHVATEPTVIVRQEQSAIDEAHRQDEEELDNGIERPGVRPDLAIHCTNRILYVDVSIAHPFAPSYKDKSASTVIAEREKSKIAKYSKATRAFVYPIVFDTFGNRGRHVDKLLKCIRPYAIVDQQNFMKLARQELTFALHRAAARCAHQSAMWIATHSSRFYNAPEVGQVGVAH